MAQLATETDGNGAALRSYIYGAAAVAMTSGGATYYFHHDRLGSVANLTASNGATEWSYTYDLFGNPRTTTKVDPGAPTNPIGYVGQLLDASGLYDLRARMYDPNQGRFLGTDPTPEGPLSPFINAYDYAGQDPINGYDLDGMRWCKFACPAVDAGLRLTALAVYTPYYAAYQANRYAGAILPSQISAQLFVVQVLGLAGDAGVDKLKQKAGTSPKESTFDENPPGKKGSINPFGDNPQTHLPGL